MCKSSAPHAAPTAPAVPVLIPLLEFFGRLTGKMKHRYTRLGLEPAVSWRLPVKLCRALVILVPVVKRMKKFLFYLKP